MLGVRVRLNNRARFHGPFATAYYSSSFEANTPRPVPFFGSSGLAESRNIYLCMLGKTKSLALAQESARIHGVVGRSKVITSAAFFNVLLSSSWHYKI